MVENLRISILGFVLLFFLAYISANAQKNSSNEVVSISISAEVVSNVEILSIQPVQINKAAKERGIIDISPLRDAAAGIMKAAGKPNARITLEYSKNGKIFNASNFGYISVNYIIAVSQTKNQSASELVLNEFQPFILNEKGELFIWVGGEIDLSNATPGIYNGSFVLRVEYI